MTLGDELLEREFEREKLAKKILAKHKLGKHETS